MLPKIIDEVYAETKNADVAKQFAEWSQSASFDAVVKAYKNPEHAPDKSNAKAFFRCKSFCIRQAVEGKQWSGVIVAHITASISSGLIPAFPNAIWPALTPISEDDSWSSAIRRSFIPVLVVIHSSVVSTSFSKSLFVSIFAGR